MNNNIYSNETVKAIRKVIKTKCPSLSVKKGTGTAGAWLDVNGSLGFGEFTAEEQKAVFELGLMSYEGQCTHGVNISPDERRFLVQKWGIEA